jgi:archaellum component FlaC
MEMHSLFTAVLYVLFGLVGWVLKDKATELKRVEILLNKTREEVARDHVTRMEVRNDMQQIIDRFDKLEAKLDRYMEHKNA